MTRLPVLSLFAPALFLAAPAVLAADEGGPLAAVEAFHAALARGDRAAVIGLLDEEVQVFEQGHVEQSRAAYVAEHLDSDIAFSKGTTSETGEVTVIARDGLAWVARQGRTRGTFEGRDVNTINLETMVLQHGKDGWKIVHIHWSARKGT